MDRTRSSIERHAAHFFCSVGVLRIRLAHPGNHVERSESGPTSFGSAPAPISANPFGKHFLGAGGDQEDFSPKCPESVGVMKPLQSSRIAFGRTRWACAAPA